MSEATQPYISHIWAEEAEPDNPFEAKACYCHGYDVYGDLLGKAGWAESLNSEPGITSSHFGAGASRPIIRGMDGPRVKVMSDGAELHDASTISPDHAVVSEPLLATQIEVLRGPSALVYGNGAVGGPRPLQFIEFHAVSPAARARVPRTRRAACL